MATYRLTQLNRVFGPAILMVAFVLAACAPSQPLATPTVAPTATSRPTVTPAATATPSQTPTPQFGFNPQKGKLEWSVAEGSLVVEWEASGESGCFVKNSLGLINIDTSVPCTVEFVVTNLEETKKQLKPSAPAWVRDLLDQAIAELSP